MRNIVCTNSSAHVTISLQPTETLSTALSLVHDQITHKLDLARSAAQQATERLTLIQQRNQFSQQQIYEAESRIDQLLTQLKQPSYPFVSTDEESVIDRKPADRVEELQHQIQQRSELLRQSAHDLKGNFVIIQGSTDLLNQAQTDKQRQQWMSMLQRNLQQATQQLNQLLDVTRLESGEEQRQLTNFDVGKLLSSLVKEVRPLAGEKGLWVQKAGGRSLRIEGDSVKLYRIAQNLLLNAIKYTHTGGVLLGWGIGVRSQEWFLTVTDTGPGLAVGSQQTSGEGIGLLIVKRLCTLLDGQLSIEALNEGGTLFRACFPRRYT